MQITPEQPNPAQRLLESLGIASAGTPKSAHASKNASSTRSGPGRYAQHGTPGNRISKPRPMRAYKALMAAWASKRVTKPALRDENGAYTLVGAHRQEFVQTDNDHPGDGYTQWVGRRKWLAGISAQRGF